MAHWNGYDFDKRKNNLCLRPIYGGDNGYEWVDAIDEDEYYHDFNSYYRFINRLPALQRLMARGEFVGDDVWVFPE